MKKGYHRLNGPGLLNIMIIISFLFTSCDTYNFSAPQPNDKKNIYQFPDVFLGRWKEKDSVYRSEVNGPVEVKGGDQFMLTNDQQNKTPLGKADADGRFYHVFRNYLLIVDVEKERILTGAWPKLNNKNELVYPGNGLRYLYEIHYDSLNRPVDTVRNYIFSGNKIYEKESEGILLTGNDFTREKDTITVVIKDSTFYDLGQNAFLRKLTENLYVFNINNTILGINEGRIERSRWWSPVVLELAGKNKIIRWQCNEKASELPCMFFARNSKSDQFYFDCSWSTAEILRLMKEGYFEKIEVLERMEIKKQ